MSLLGHRDLYVREILEFLNGTIQFTVEKKIEPEFQKPQEGQTAELADAASLFADNAACHFAKVLQGKYHRAFELAVIIFVLQNRASFTFETFQNAVKASNASASGKADAHHGFFTTAKELGLLQANLPHLKETARLILAVFLARVSQDLVKVETCTFLEHAKVGDAFLKEIGKGCLEDRWMAKLLGLYHNYFKHFEPTKGEPPAELYSELQLVAQLERDNAAFEKSFLANISFERKAHLDHKSVRDNPHLLQFMSTYKVQLRSSCETVIRIQRLKDKRSAAEVTGFPDPKEDTPISEVACNALGAAVLADAKRIYERVKAQAEADAKTAAEKKKFKRKISKSWGALEALCSSKPASEAETAKLIELDTWLADLPFGGLTEALSGILAPSDQTSKDPKIPKGTRDTNPLQMIIKSRAIDKIRSIYYKHGAVEIDTPIFELKETLMGKYGEEGGKLIYDLEDQGGELLSLRYDLTVPFARFMGTYSLQKMKRFHIGKVYRRDQPNINRGRFREFYQCDFDIAGKTDPMLAEAEILKIAVEILSGFDLKFKIKVSHRLLLEAIIEVAGCELNKFRTICSSIDKLDKEPWQAVERELQAEKGLTPEQTAVLQGIVLHKGTIPEVLKLAEEKKLFGENPKARKSLEELRIMNDFIEIFGISQYIDLDLSLARGLDYYTGVIYEGVLADEETGVALGSIAGGGRYDQLIGMFSKDHIPAIGISIGIERLFTILEKKYKDASRESEAEFLVATIGKKGTLEKKLELATKLWAGDIKSEILYDMHPRPDKQLKHALEKKIPYIIWVGEDEVVKKVYKVKVLYKREEFMIEEDKLVEEARKLSAQYHADLKNGLVVFQE